MNSILKFGIGAGLALSILVFAGYTLEWYKVSFKLGWPLLEMVIIIFALYYGLKEIRKVNYGGTIKYRKALAEGLKIVFLFTIIHSLTIYLYFTFNEKKFIEYKTYTINSNITAMKQAGYPKGDITAFLKLVNEEFTPFIMGRDNSIFDLLLGLVVTLIVASILRQQDPPRVEVINP